MTSSLPADKSSAALVLTGAIVLCVALGSVHGFSVFLEPIEEQTGATRATVSLTYSFALIALTVLVLVGPRLYGRVSPSGLVLLVGVIAASGAYGAGQSDTIPGFWVFFSCAFGAANGLGYGFALQFAGQVWFGREGMAMGLVTAGYALGAVVSPWAFQDALSSGGLETAMSGFAVVLLGAAVIAALCFQRAGCAYVSSRNKSLSDQSGDTFLIWCAYGAAVLAGLMAIGHAAAIAAQSTGAFPPWWAPAVLSAFNLVGSLLGGQASDRWPPGRLLAALTLMSAASLTCLAGFPDGWVMLCAFGGIGFAYGGTIAAYPAIIAKRFGSELGPRVYGRVFTAWGAAGLAGPWLAGAIFDETGGYTVALLAAVVIALLSAVVAARIFKS